VTDAAQAESLLPLRSASWPGAGTIARSAVPTVQAFTIVFSATAAAMAFAVLVGLAVPSRSGARALAPATA
jgi:hypothetical protein